MKEEATLTSPHKSLASGFGDICFEMLDGISSHIRSGDSTADNQAAGAFMGTPSHRPAPFAKTTGSLSSNDDDYQQQSAAHDVYEYWMQPSRYRTQLCNEGERCSRKVCFFAHSLEELREAPAATDDDVLPGAPPPHSRGSRSSASDVRHSADNAINVEEPPSAHRRHTHHQCSAQPAGSYSPSEVSPPATATAAAAGFTALSRNASSVGGLSAHLPHGYARPRTPSSSGSSSTGPPCASTGAPANTVSFIQQLLLEQQRQHLRHAGEFPPQMSLSALLSGLALGSPTAEAPSLMAEQPFSLNNPGLLYLQQQQQQQGRNVQQVGRGGAQPPQLAAMQGYETNEAFLRQLQAVTGLVGRSPQHVTRDATAAAAGVWPPAAPIVTSRRQQVGGYTGPLAAADTTQTAAGSSTAAPAGAAGGRAKHRHGVPVARRAPRSRKSNLLALGSDQRLAATLHQLAQDASMPLQQMEIARVLQQCVVSPQVKSKAPEGASGDGDAAGVALSYAGDTQQPQLQPSHQVDEMLQLCTASGVPFNTIVRRQQQRQQQAAALQPVSPDASSGGSQPSSAYATYAPMRTAVSAGAELFQTPFNPYLLNTRGQTMGEVSIDYISQQQQQQHHVSQQHTNLLAQHTPTPARAATYPGNVLDCASNSLLGAQLQLLLQQQQQQQLPPGFLPSWTPSSSQTTTSAANNSYMGGDCMPLYF